MEEIKCECGGEMNFVCNIGDAMLKIYEDKEGEMFFETPQLYQCKECKTIKEL